MKELKTHFLIRHKNDHRRVRCACYLRYYFLESLAILRINGTFNQEDATCGNCKRIVFKNAGDKA